MFGKYSVSNDKIRYLMTKLLLIRYNIRFLGRNYGLYIEKSQLKSLLYRNIRMMLIGGLICYNGAITLKRKEVT